MKKVTTKSDLPFKKKTKENPFDLVDQDDDAHNRKNTSEYSN